MTITANQIIELAYESLKGNVNSINIINDIFEESNLERLSKDRCEFLEIGEFLIRKNQEALVEVEKIAEQGYAEAWELLTSIRMELEHTRSQLAETRLALDKTSAELSDVKDAISFVYPRRNPNIE